MYPTKVFGIGTTHIIKHASNVLGLTEQPILLLGQRDIKVKYMMVSFFLKKLVVPIYIKIAAAIFSPSTRTP